MARAMARLQAWSLEAGALDIKPGATLRLFEEGTAATTRVPLAVPLYSAKTGGTVLGTVLTADSTGQKTIFTSSPCRFDVEVSGSGISTYQYPDEAFDVDPGDLIYHVRLYGILGDGTTDNYDLAQDLVETVHADGGGRIRFEKGVYRLSSTLNLRSDVVLEGAGIGSTTLLWDDPADVDVATQGAICITASTSWSDFGTTGDSGYVGSNPAIVLHTGTTINAGDRVVRLATAGDVSKFAVGDVVQLFNGSTGTSSPSMLSQGVLTTKVTEIQDVAGVKYLWLRDPSPWTFTQPTDKARLRYRLNAIDPVAYPLADRCGVRDLAIAVGDGAGNPRYGDNRQYGILLSGVVDAAVDGVHIARTRYRGVRPDSTIGLKITNCWFDEIVSSEPGTDGADGCAVEDYWSNGTIIRGNSVTATGWGFTSNGSYGMTIQGNHVMGRFLPYDDGNPATNPTGNRIGGGSPVSSDVGWRIHGRGIKLQQQCVHAQIAGNIVEGSVLWGLLVLDSGYVDVLDNQLLFCGGSNTEHAIVVEETVGAGGLHHIKVDGNTVRGAANVGISLSLTNAANAHASITNNIVAGCAGVAISVDRAILTRIVGNTIDQCGGGAIVLANGATCSVITSNAINNSAGAINTSAGGGTNIVKNNLVLAGSNVLHAGDLTTVTDYLLVASNPVSVAAWTTVTRSSDSSQHAVTLYVKAPGNPVTAYWTGAVTTTAGTAGRIGISVDGAAPQTLIAIPANATLFPVSIRLTTPSLTLGPHTFALQMYADSGVASITAAGNTILGELTAVEDCR